jgi:hypothetical protein
MIASLAHMATIKSVDSWEVVRKSIFRAKTRQLPWHFSPFAGSVSGQGRYITSLIAGTEKYRTWYRYKGYMIY